MKGSPGVFSQNISETNCLSIPLKNGYKLRLAWVRLGGIDLGYGDNFWPAGLGAIWSFYPSARNLAPVDGNNWSERGSGGSCSFSSFFQYQFDIPRNPSWGATYFTTYQERDGTYFEYFLGANADAPDAGRLNRQYDLHGNELKYEHRYVSLGGVDTLMPFAMGGSALGRVAAYFEYSGDTGFVERYHIGKVYLLDLDAPANSRTIYFDYSDPVSPVVSKVVYPNGCTELYEEYGGGAAERYHNILYTDVDAEGFATYFVYGEGEPTEIPTLKQTIEPEGRITYYEYTSVVATQKTLLGRGTTYFNYVLGSTNDEPALPTVQVDPLGNETKWGYDPVVDTQVARRVNPNGDITYFEYVGGSAPNVFAVSRQLKVTNGAQTYYGYNGKTFDLAKVVGPRHTSSFNFTTYYEYNSTRDRIAQVDALGNVTRFGYDSVGRKTKIQDARSNTTYFNYGLNSGNLESMGQADGSVAYFGYNSFRDKQREVSPRWTELSFSAFTTYYEYDSLSRRTKTIDPLSNVTYFDWTSRGDLLDTVDALGTTTAYSYNGLRLQTKTTVTSKSGTVLSEVKDGFDTFKNRIRTLDGLGNATYFFYDHLDRLTSRKDPLQNLGYFYYDSVGNRTSQTDARNNSTYFFYDQLSRLTARRDALANITYYFYDVEDNRTHIVDSRKNATYHFYDALNRSNVMRDALLHPTYYFYDAVGNQSILVNARFVSTYFGYDAVNRPTRVQDAIGNSIYFAFDIAGNLTQTTDGRQNTTQVGFDQLNRKSAMRDALGNAIYFFYDEVGNRTKVVDARLNTSYFFYDGLRRTTVTRDALANPTYFFYDLGGNPTVMMNARFAAAYFGYDVLLRMSKVQDALANTIYYVYDAVGNRTHFIDARRSTTYFFYDALDRVNIIRDALANPTYYFYDPVGNRSVKMNARFAAAYFGYDALDQMGQFQDALGNTVYFGYDSVGNRTIVVNARIATTYFGFDAVNRPVRIQDAAGSTTYLEYDPVGSPIRECDADDHATLIRYDALNRVDAVRFADAGSTYFFYDETSNETKEVDPLGKATYFGYDALNRLSRIQDALGQTLYYEYDDVGNRTRYQDAEGAGGTYTYDAINRRTNTTFVTGGSIVSATLRSDPYFVYDEVRNLVQMGDFWGLHRMGYDALNRLAQHQYPYAQVVYYEYDEVSNPKAMVFPESGGRQTAAFDSLDRMQRSQATTGAHVTYFEYDVVSNLTRKVFANNQKLFVTYDAVDRPEQWRFAKNSGQALSYFDYTRDSKGLITKSVRETTHTVYYRYDVTDRLVAEIWSKSGTPEVYAYRYDYDVAGNRTRARMNGADTYYFYDSANQLKVTGTDAVYATPTYYIYDKNGSLTNLVEPSGATYFAYNAAGLVARIRWQDATATYFFYDGMLQRYAMNANGTLAYFLWDDTGLLEERDAGGTVTERHTHGVSPIKGIGTVVQSFRPTQAAALQRIYPVMDPRGSITQWHESDETTVLAGREYDAFGQIIPNSATGTWPNRFGYQGQLWLEVLSGNSTQRLLLSPTRIYDPATGRFLSRDPLNLGNPSNLGMGLYERDPEFIPFNSQKRKDRFLTRFLGHGTNAYTIVSSNPVTKVDPIGLQEWQNTPPPPPMPPPIRTSGGTSSPFVMPPGYDEAIRKFQAWVKSWKTKLLCVIRCVGKEVGKQKQYDDRADHLQNRGFAHGTFGQAGFTDPAFAVTNLSLDLAGDCKSAVDNYLHESIHSLEGYRHPNALGLGGQEALFQQTLSVIRGDTDLKLDGCCCNQEKQNTWAVRKGQCDLGQTWTQTVVEKCCCICNYNTLTRGR